MKGEKKKPEGKDGEKPALMEYCLRCNIVHL